MSTISAQIAQQSLHQYVSSSSATEWGFDLYLLVFLEERFAFLAPELISLASIEYICNNNNSVSGVRTIYWCNELIFICIPGAYLYSLAEIICDSYSLKLLVWIPIFLIYNANVFTCNSYLD